MLKDSIFNLIMKSLDGPNQFSSPDEALTHTFFKTSSKILNFETLNIKF